MKKVVISLGHIIFLFLIFAENLPATDEKRLALLIGNSDYTSSGTLRNPINDVRGMKETLEALGFSVMKYENCTQKQMKEAIDAFGRKLKGQDVGLFFYAGHGVQAKGHNYLIPIDAKLDSENDAEYNCVRADRVLAKMEAAGSRTNIAILDACRDNPFARSWRRGADGTGLAFMDAPSGSLIAYSTAPGRTALDGTGTNSIYTSALIHHIHTRNISALQMFQRVRSSVMNISGNEQIPWESTSLRGDFYFNDEKGTVSSPHKEEETIGEFDAVALNKQANLLFDKGNYLEATKILNKLIELDSKNASSYLNNRGFAFNKLNQFNKAIKDYDKAIGLDPKFVLAYLGRGGAYAQLNEPIKAIQDFNKAIELDTRNEEAYYSRGTSYVGLKQYDKAVQDFNMAIELEPKFMLAYLNRGLTYANLDEPIKAIKDYDKAIELDPRFAPAYSNRGNVYIDLSEPVKAVKDCDKAIELDPRFAPAYYNRGNAYSNLSEPIKAIKDYDVAIELDPKLSGAYLNRGRVYALLKQYTEAMQDVTRAIELDPKLAEAYALRASAYYVLEQPIKALKDCDTALELNCRHAGAYRTRGAVYLEWLNRRKQGCSDLKKACELGDCEGLNIANEMGYCR